jgi:POT family proton-dependent oligopeptide transporter
MSAIARLKQHPAGFWFIFWGELAERASFYGMRTILALYMLEVLGFQEANAAAIMPAFMAACYLTPLLGGFLADRVLGRYKTILYFSGPYVLGHIILGGLETRAGLFIALVLLALGSGSIKPNTSTLMGQMYEEQKKDALLTEAFSYFYAAINIGSTIATLGLPWIRERVSGLPRPLPSPLTPEQFHALERGYAVALMIPAALMVAAFGAFAVGKKHYPVEHVGKLPPKTSEQRAAERATLVRISGIFALIAVFWFVYDQAASTWIYFAKDHMDLSLGFGISTTPDQVQGLNPLLIVVLTPIFNALWEHFKRRRGGVEIPDTRKMLIGFVIVFACMAIMAAVGFAAGDGKVTVWWLCLATLVITLSELCISVVGLEFAFKVAAPGTKSVVTAAFLMTVFVGDTVQTFFNKALWKTVSPGVFFAIQAAIMALAAVLFYVVARRFEQPAKGEAPAAA